jgi:enamine deaminase RidA (YjgF/YER057c/UK114 family)
MSTPEDRITELGLSLPQVPTPLAAYVPAVRTGNVVFTSGQLPLIDGTISKTGKVGSEVSVDEANALAQVCVLNALAAVKAEIGELSRICRIVKVVGFVASAPDFSSQPLVVNGASQVLKDVFGDIGVHARSSLGVAVLPMDAPVEIELIVEVE